MFLNLFICGVGLFIIYTTHFKPWLEEQEIGPFSEFLLALIIQSEPERLKEENRTFFVKIKEK